MGGNVASELLFDGGKRTKQKLVLQRDHAGVQTAQRATSVRALHAALHRYTEHRDMLELRLPLKSG